MIDQADANGGCMSEVDVDMIRNIRTGLRDACQAEMDDERERAIVRAANERRQQEQHSWQIQTQMEGILREKITELEAMEANGDESIQGRLWASRLLAASLEKQTKERAGKA